MSTFVVWLFNFNCFFFSSRRRHTRFDCDWSSDVCSSDLEHPGVGPAEITEELGEVAVESGELSVRLEDAPDQLFPPLPLQGLDLTGFGPWKGERGRGGKAASKALTDLFGRRPHAVFFRQSGVALADRSYGFDQRSRGVEKDGFERHKIQATGNSR